MITLSRRLFLSGAAIAAVLPAQAAAAPRRADRFAASPWRKVSDAEWKRRLPPQAYRTLRREDTERPDTSPFTDSRARGTYVCAGCALPLFRSEWKFHSGTGWPSFWTAHKQNLGTKRDLVLLIPRTEYHCARCLGHQGHIFDDGPREHGGVRYCNNGAALKFVAA